MFTRNAQNIADNAITAQDIQRMITHWLNTPVNGYLGSDYGSDAKSLLQKALHSGVANAFIAKMKKDLPILSVIPEENVSLYSLPEPPDKIRIYIAIAGITTIEIKP
jgi:hypothetical protein